MKSDCIFAVKVRQTFDISRQKREDRLYPDGSFTCKDTAVEFPCDPSNSVCVGQVWRLSGSLTAFLIYILSGFISQMPNLNEIRSAVNNSSRSSASAREKGTSYADVRLLCNNPYSIPRFEDFIAEANRRFDEECAAKNMAYSFIMSLDLIERFHEFCRIHEGEDGHAGCVDILLNNQ